MMLKYSCTDSAPKVAEKKPSIPNYGESLLLGMVASRIGVVVTGRSEIVFVQDSSFTSFGIG